MTNDATRASSSAAPSARSRPALEIAVTSAAGAVTARDGGADRVELCSALELGGVTPSQGLVEATVATGVPVHALVRCRPGGFVYDADELDVMVREIRALVRSGVAGVVVGALREDGSLDVDAVRWFVEAALDAAAAPHPSTTPQESPRPQLAPRGLGGFLGSHRWSRAHWRSPCTGPWTARRTRSRRWRPSWGWASRGC
jgi:copper homeostasis protein